MEGAASFGLGIGTTCARSRSPHRGREAYSTFSAASGSAFAARRDGIRQARRATLANRMALTPNTTGSVGLTSIRKPAVNGVTTAAARDPSAHPIGVNRRAEPRPGQCDWRGAPAAATYVEQTARQWHDAVSVAEPPLDGRWFVTKGRTTKQGNSFTGHRGSARSPWIYVVPVATALAGSAWALLSTDASSAGGQSPEPVLQSLRVEILREFPHDTTAFTQGLLWREGWLYESTGQPGESTLRRVDPRTGDVMQMVDIPAEFHGEGLALVEDRLLMLTYKAERGFVYDVETFDTLRTFEYPGEGWGLCYDGRRLVMSNGSDTLAFRNPETFEETDAVQVTMRGQARTQLNELECVDDMVYANIWLDDYIVIIDPSSGRVTHQIDASGLLTAEESLGADVLNGVAYDPQADTFYITGKDWPKMFEVRFVQ